MTAAPAIPYKQCTAAAAYLTDAPVATAAPAITYKQFTEAAADLTDAPGV